MVVLIIAWWSLLWFIRKILTNKKTRPPRVLALTYLAFGLIGTIGIFNIAIVPVVLFAFHNLAIITLVTCGIAACSYFINVKDDERHTLMSGHSIENQKRIKGRNQSPFDI
jgi:heme A synthase